MANSSWQPFRESTINQRLGLLAISVWAAWSTTALASDIAFHSPALTVELRDDVFSIPVSTIRDPQARDYTAVIDALNNKIHGSTKHCEGIPLAQCQFIGFQPESVVMTTLIGAFPDAREKGLDLERRILVIKGRTHPDVTKYYWAFLPESAEDFAKAAAFCGNGKCVGEIDNTSSRTIGRAHFGTLNKAIFGSSGAHKKENEKTGEPSRPAR